jgi:16S rRNA (adenine1518-N6/adenine1519-N6)-dimethyltransferase
MNKFNPTKISDIKKIWEDEGFKLKKGLSQNFLIDQNIVDKIVLAADIKSGDVVLEIGPGSGALTASLLDKGAVVYAVEFDHSASSILRKYLGHNDRFHLIEGDILDTDLSFLPMGTKIVSNLPYHITSPIIALIADKGTTFSSSILMVQKEMADRIMAEAPSRNRSSFSVFTDYFFEKKFLFVVKPGCFIPKPKVDSVIISLVQKRSLPLKNSDEFVAFVRKAFSQKRKMISSVMKEFPIAELLTQIGCNHQARPEELSLKNFLDLYCLLFPSR